MLPFAVTVFIWCFAYIHIFFVFGLNQKDYGMGIFIWQSDKNYINDFFWELVFLFLKGKPMKKVLFFGNPFGSASRVLNFELSMLSHTNRIYTYLLLITKSLYPCNENFC